MPHMMPMLWMLIFIMSFLSLIILSSMIYFFYLPNTKMNTHFMFKKFNNLNKWNWMW